MKTNKEIREEAIYENPAVAVCINSTIVNACVDNIQNRTRDDENYFILKELKSFIADLEVRDYIEAETIFVELRKKIKELKRK